MSAHNHSTVVDGCYRCDLGKDEVRAMHLDMLTETVEGLRSEADGMTSPRLEEMRNFYRAVALWLDAIDLCDCSECDYAIAVARAYLGEDL